MPTNGRSEGRTSSARDVTIPIDQPNLHSVVERSLLEVQELNRGGGQLLGLSTLATQIDNSKLPPCPL